MTTALTHYLPLPTTFVAALLLSGTFVTAQEPDLLWSTAYGGQFWEKGYGGSPAGDGFVIVGYTESFGVGEADLYIVRVDGFGDTLWTRVHGGPEQDEGYSIEQTQDGGFIVGGHFAYDSEESPGVAWILRLDENGDMRWPFMQSNTDMYYRVNGVRETPDGNFVIVGTATSPDFLTSSGWIALLDAQGQLQWSKTFTPVFGGAFTSVDFTGEDGFAVAGFLGASSTNVDAWLLQFDSAGDTLWTRRFGLSSGDAFSSVRVRDDGSYVCVGTTESFGQEDTDILFVELRRSEPDFIRIEWYGGLDRDYGNSVLLTGDGGCLIGGTTEKPSSDDFDAWVIRLDSERNVKWSSRFGGTKIDEGMGVYPTRDGGYWLVGSTESLSNGPSDAWLLRLSTDPLSGVGNEPPTAGGLRLDDPSPNPFTHSTAVRWHLDKSEHVAVTVQDVLGRPVRTLMNDRLDPGTYSIEWNGLDQDSQPAPAGTYFCVISVNGQPHSSKMIVLTR